MVKNLPVSAGDTGLIPGWGRSPGVGNGNPLQYSCLENPTAREKPGRLQSRVQGWGSGGEGHKESDMTKHTHTHTHLQMNICQGE